MAWTTDIAVVGGGMSGLTAALALAGTGFEVTLVEREAPRAQLTDGFDGRVSSLAWGSRLTLEALGVWDALAPHAQPILEIRVSDRGGPLFLHYDHRDVGDHPLGYIVENRFIRRALDAAAEASIATAAPASVVGFEPGTGGARLSLDDGRRLACRLVVACDGARSALRGMAGLRHGALDYGQTGIVCTVAHERPHRGIAHERFLAGGPFAILPLPGNLASLVWTEREVIARRVLELDRDELLEEIAWRFGDFLGALELRGPVWSYPLKLVLAERMTGERLALVGDAARHIHPLAGQGYNLGIRDVAALADTLSRGRRIGLDPADALLLEDYARRRCLDGLALVAVTDGLNRLFSNTLPPLAPARALGLAAVNRITPLKRLFMRHAMGTLGSPSPTMRREAS